MGAILERTSNSKNHGFTIVELLIVVVVIAILAAITIVSYNGITLRAENTKTLSAVEAYANAITAYGAINNDYPPAGPGADNGFVCLGAATCNRIGGTDNGQWNCYQGAHPNLNARGTVAPYGPTNDAIKTIIQTLPDISSQAIGCDSGVYRGIFYYRFPNYQPVLWYFLKGKQTCKSMGSLYDVSEREGVGPSPTGGMTMCVAEFSPKT